MPVVSNPQYNPTSAYQPIVYNVFYTASPDIVKYCEFTIFVNGTEIATGRKSFYASTPIFGSVEYYFLIDIQEYLQRWLAPNRSKSSMFGTLGAASQIDNTDAYAEVYLEFRYLILSATTGKIYDSPTFDTSDNRIVDMATRQNGENRSFDEFIWTPLVTPARFLTNAPIQKNICRDGNEFVSFMSDWNWMRVQTYTSSFVLITDSYAPTGNSGNIGHTTVSVGIDQLTAISWFNAVNPSFVGAEYYVITFGIGVITSPTTIIFVGNPIQKTYRIEDCCDKKLRFFWLNHLGGVDNYNFCFTELKQNVSAKVFEKALGWSNLAEPPHSQSDFGKALTTIQASRQYSISDKLKNTDLLWVKDLFNSAEIYIQNPDLSDEYWRVYVVAATFVERVNKGVVNVAFDIYISQDIVTHRI